MNATDFCEKRLLPLVVAFGFGVVAMKLSVEHREAEAQQLATAAIELADDAIYVAETYRSHCEVFEAGQPVITVVRDGRHD